MAVWLVVVHNVLSQENKDMIYGAIFRQKLNGLYRIGHLIEVCHNNP